MKILVTGGNGLLGQYLVHHLIDKGYHVLATGKGDCRISNNEKKDLFQYQTLDITNGSQVERLFSAYQPDVVVHAAAMTQVDACELNHDQCFETNVQGTSQVLMDAELYGKHFIYISTDFVFDGVKGNYSESDDTAPVSWYGFTKLQAEAMVENASIPWTIIRTCLVYGQSLEGARSNIIQWVKDSLEKEITIKVVNDQVRTPTYVKDLVQGIALVIEKKATGIYHIAGEDILTPYAMAVATAQKFSLNKLLITEVNASSFSQPAKRPPITGLNIARAKMDLGYTPVSFQQGLADMFEVNN